MIVSRLRATPDPWHLRPMRVVTMIVNQFVQIGHRNCHADILHLMISAETTRARVTGHILTK